MPYGMRCVTHSDWSDLEVGDRFRCQAEGWSGTVTDLLGDGVCVLKDDEGGWRTLDLSAFDLTDTVLH